MSWLQKLNTPYWERVNKNWELRFIITQDCNYKCVFCHEEGLQWKHKNTLSPEDYKYLFLIWKEVFGINTTTLSGGEPLFRKDFEDIVAGMKESWWKITVVSNGSLIKQRIWAIAYIDRLNISVHSLEKQKYEEIVQVRNSFKNIVENILLAKEVNPNIEIRLNSALLKNLNASEEKVWEYLEFASKLWASIKYMELYPNTSNDFYSLDELSQNLEKNGCNKTDWTSPESRQITFFKWDTKIIWTRIFCAQAEKSEKPKEYCNRNNDLFITPNWTIKICREHPYEIPILEDIKNRNSEILAEKIHTAFQELGSNCVL